MVALDTTLAKTYKPYPKQNNKRDSCQNKGQYFAVETE